MDEEIKKIADNLAKQVGDGSMGLPIELREAVIAMPERYKEGGPSEKAKPPKGRAVALSTTCQELYMIFQEC